jgi:hypothetical protein
VVDDEAPPAEVFVAGAADVVVESSVPGEPGPVESDDGVAEPVVVDGSEFFPSDESPPREQAVTARARMRSRTRTFTAAHPRGGVRCS